MPAASTLNPADFAQVSAQLGRPPRGRCAVAVRCPAGHVAVIRTDPLQRDGERVVPFPTLYWLTCPTLCRAIATLERDGLIASLHARLRHDGALRAALAEDHGDYIARRAALFDNAAGNFGGRGIGGMANFAAVKCLHAHYAHHLVSHNVIGEIVESEYGIVRCERKEKAGKSPG